jgi:hypothetical protein
MDSVVEHISETIMVHNKWGDWVHLVKDKNSNWWQLGRLTEDKDVCIEEAKILDEAKNGHISI